MRSLVNFVIVFVLAEATFLMPDCASRAQVADTIYTGGDIVTVNDRQPAAEAVAVKDGKILAVGAARRDRA